MDPQYSVLLGNDNKGICGENIKNNNDKTKLAVAIVVPVVVVLALSVALVIAFGSKYVVFFFFVFLFFGGHFAVGKDRERELAWREPKTPREGNERKEK
jgi:hypothetical protein